MALYCEMYLKLNSVFYGMRQVWLNVLTQSFDRFLFWQIRVIASAPKDHGGNVVIFCMTGGQTEEQAGADQLYCSDLIFSQLHQSRFSDGWSWEQALLIFCTWPYCVGHSQWELSGTAGDKEKLQRWALYCLETRALWWYENRVYSFSSYFQGFMSMQVFSLCLFDSLFDSPGVCHLFILISKYHENVL